MAAELSSTGAEDEDEDEEEEEEFLPFLLLSGLLGIVGAHKDGKG